MSNPLFKAIEIGDLARVQEAIRSGADVNGHQEIDFADCTPLIFAAQISRDPALIKLLLDAGAEINGRDENDWTPLMWAVRSDCYVNVVKALLDAGADANAQTRHGGTVLMIAAMNCQCPEVYELLLTAGADVNARDENGSTPLMNAVRLSDSTVIADLLAAGADINAQDQRGLTPLMLAFLRNTDLDVISLLLNSGADGTVPGPDGATLLMMAAARNSNTAILVELLGTGADVNARSNDGITALMIAAYRNENPEVVTTLLEAGAEVDAADNHGLTALMYAAWGSGNAKIISALLEAGADVNRRADRGWTALMLAAGFNRHPEVTGALLEAGADANAVTTDGGWTPLMFAGRFNPRGEVVCALLDAGADEEARDSNGKSPSNHVRNNESFRNDRADLPGELTEKFRRLQRDVPDRFAGGQSGTSPSAFDRVVAALKWGGKPYEVSMLMAAFRQYHVPGSDTEQTFSKLASAYLDGGTQDETAQREALREASEAMGIDFFAMELERCLTSTRPYVRPSEKPHSTAKPVAKQKELPPKDRLFFPWKHVDAARVDSKLQARNDSGVAIHRYASEVYCQLCRKPGAQLAWFYFRSPDWTWADMCGRAGWMAVCDDCHHQVFFKITKLN